MAELRRPDCENAQFARTKYYVPEILPEMLSPIQRTRPRHRRMIRHSRRRVGCRPEPPRMPVVHLHHAHAAGIEPPGRHSHVHADDGGRIGCQHFDVGALNPQCASLFGALTVDLMTRGLLTIPLPSNAFDESPVNSLTGDIDPLLDDVFSTLGNGIGSLVVDLKAFNWPNVATDVASLAADSGQSAKCSRANPDQKWFYRRSGEHIFFKRQWMVIAHFRRFELSSEATIDSTTSSKYF